MHEKLVRRHPHVFGQVEAEHAAEVLRNWDAIKRTEPGREAGIFGEVPENLPALLHARKIQRRAASSGFDPATTEESVAAVGGQTEALAAAGEDRDACFAAVGDLLFAVTNVARKLQVDPELALRSSSARFRAAVERAEELARRSGATWSDLDESERLGLYARARLAEADGR